MTKTAERSFIFARSSKELTSRKSKVLYYVWNWLMLILSSAALCAVCLTLAIGLSEPELYLGYFRCPLIFLLNFIPFFLFQLLMLCIFNRQWAAFLSSAVLFGAAHVGSFYKYVERNEPFTFSDMSSISAGLKIAGSYHFQLNSRIILLLICVVLGTLFLFFLAKGRPNAKTRIVSVLLVILSIFPLWQFVYSSSEIYYEKTPNDDFVLPYWPQEVFVSKGFAYPFIYSIKSAAGSFPDDYSEEDAAALLLAYEDEEIPSDRKVNILVFQLESFSELPQAGFKGIDEEAYRLFHELQAESISGLITPNGIGGGTINTEHCVLTGGSVWQDFTHELPTYVSYLGSQGYLTTGNHPNSGRFYNRLNLNRYIGFDEYFYGEDGYNDFLKGNWICDDILMPEVLRQMRARLDQGRNVFSFNVTLQGHSPYNSEELVFDNVFWDADVSEPSYYSVNNYLGSVYSTQQHLMAAVNELRNWDEPVVLLAYGDHKPLFPGHEVYNECGIDYDLSTLDGFLSYYASPYIIWANDAAKSVSGNDFCGEGPTISPCYLMNVLFDELGWKGSSFMQYADTVMESLPIVHTSGYYLDNGSFTLALAPDSEKLLHDFVCAQFYLSSK